MGKDYTALAIIGYAAYCEASNGLAFDGSPLKTWDELDEARQNNWRANAQAIEKAVIAEQSCEAEAAGLDAAGQTSEAPEQTETVTVAETTTFEGNDGNVTLEAGDQVEVPVAKPDENEAKDQQAA